MKKKRQTLLAVILAIVAVVLFVVTMDWDLKHIEDTNGPDNYALTTITEQDIIENEMLALTPYTKKQALLGNGITVHSKKFTGVTEILYNNYFGNSHVILNLENFQVKEGNFVLAVVNDGKIVATAQPDAFGNVRIELDNMKGRVSVMIAGESANYSFSMSRADYEQFQSNMGD